MPIVIPTQAPVPVPIAVDQSVAFFNGLDLSQQYKMCSLSFASTSSKRQGKGEKEGKGGKDGKGDSSGKSGKGRNLNSRKDSSKKFKGSDDYSASDLVEPTVSAYTRVQWNFAFANTFFVLNWKLLDEVCLEAFPSLLSTSGVSFP